MVSSSADDASCYISRYISVLLARLYESIGSCYCQLVIGLGVGHTLKFYNKVFFLCDGQGTVKQAILYADSPMILLM